MGFFSKAWKSLKKGVKSIGKGLKKAFKTVGKFVNKLGIVGQIGLAFILPGIGGMLGSALGSGVNFLAGSSNALLSGVGKVLQTAGKYASTAGNAFKTVTDGVMNFAKDIGGGFINQVGTKLGSKNLIMQNGPANVADGFGRWMQGVADDVSGITSPFKEAASAVTEGVSSNYTGQYQQQMEALSNTQTGAPVFESKATQVFDTASNAITKDVTDTSIVDAIASAENKEATGFLGRVTSNVQSAVEALPEKLVDQTGRQLASGVTTSALSSLGLGPETPQYTQVTNVVPEFNSTPVSQVYERNGFNYGALPDNRLQYFASQQTGGDFGLSGYSQFSKLRTV